MEWQPGCGREFADTAEANSRLWFGALREGPALRQVQGGSNPARRAHAFGHIPKMSDESFRLTLF